MDRWMNKYVNKHLFRPITEFNLFLCYFEDIIKDPGIYCKECFHGLIQMIMVFQPEMYSAHNDKHVDA